MQIQYKKFNGINNVDSEEKVGLTAALNDQRVANERQYGGRQLVSAINVDSTNDGSLVRRDGHVLINNAPSHSLYSALGKMFYRSADKLYTLQNSQIDSGLIGITRYAGIDGIVYYTDRRKVRCSNGLVSWECGLDYPPNNGLIENVSGVLDKGMYQWALGYKRGDELGGVFQTSQVEILSGGIKFTNLPTAPSGCSVVIYLSECGGEDLFYIGQTNQASYTFTGGMYGALCENIGCHKPLAGSDICIWNSRLCIQRNNYLLYSQPYRYGVFDVVRQFIQMPEEITMMVGDFRGFMIIGTTKKTYRLSGSDFEKSTLDVVNDGGVIPYSYIKLDEPKAVGAFLTDRGVCFISEDGLVYNRTLDYYKFMAKSAFGLYRPKDGFNNVLWAVT